MTQHTVAVYVENDTGEIISDLHYLHRYDSDIYEPGTLPILEAGKLNIIGKATYWTGFGRTGYDYWWIQFLRGGVRYACKANFYCYLTSDDADGRVVLKILKDQMQVIPLKSSSCTVSLYPESALLSLIAEERSRSEPVITESNCDCKKEK